MLYCLYENTHTCLLRGRVRSSATAQVPKPGRLTHLRYWYKFVTFRNFVTDWRFESFEGRIRMGE